jgi:hypothetical protein
MARALRHEGIRTLRQFMQRLHVEFLINTVAAPQPDHCGQQTLVERLFVYPRLAVAIGGACILIFRKKRKGGRTYIYARDDTTKPVLDRLEQLREGRCFCGDKRSEFASSSATMCLLGRLDDHKYYHVMGLSSSRSGGSG